MTEAMMKDGTTGGLSSVDGISMDVVLIERDDRWVAQGLQFDIGAEGETFKDVIYELSRSIVGYIAVCRQEGVRPFEALGTAPQEYWDLWGGPHFKITLDTGPAFRAAPGVADLPLHYREVRIAAAA